MELFIKKYDGTLIKLLHTPLIDDTQEHVKNLIFISTPNISYYTSFITLISDDTLTPLTHSNILLNFKPNTKSYSIRVMNIFEEMEQKQQYLPQYYTIINTTEGENLLNDFKQRYPDLTKEDLEFVIEMILFQTNSQMYSQLQSKLQQYFSILELKKQQIFTRISKQYNELSKFYNIINTTTNIDFDVLFNNIIITSLSFTVKSNNFISGVKGRFIKLNQLFNIIETNLKIPFVAYESNNNSFPFVKIYNDINTDGKSIKKWLINEKKKSQLISYKKIKGLLIKSIKNDMIFSFNLYDNGLIHVKLENENKKLSYDQLYDFIITQTNEIIQYLNSVQGVFLYSRTIDETVNSTVRVDSISTVVDSSFFINRKKFEKELNNEALSEYVLELKDTITPDILSMLYKKYHDDDKNITINIKDNPYVSNSSIISILSFKHINQLYSILFQIFYISMLYETDKEKKRKIKEKSSIKELRKEGIDILSTKCQKPRQPILGDNPLQNSYTLSYNGKNYICPKKDHPYPGFTNDNVVCCFKKDQRQRDTYTRNIKTDDLIVQPSNYKIQLFDNISNEQKEVYLIKIISDYNSGFNEDNSVGRYYYIGNNKELVPLTNTELIEAIDNDEHDIWLEEIELSKILERPPSNKCNTPPDLSSLFNSNIHKPCENQPSKFFGYNLNSYPCCFDKERNIYKTRQKKKTFISKQHILHSDKILDKNRLGYLPKYLDHFFNKMNSGNFFKLGVVQNKNAFFNCVINILNSINETNSIKTVSQLKKYLSDELLKRDDIFFKELNSGDILLKFGTKNEYINYINSTSVKWNFVIDLIQKVFHINIFIFDLPYELADSNKETNEKDIKIICKNFHGISNDTSLSNIVIFKRKNFYELLVNITEDDQVNFTFNSQMSFIKMIMGYIKDSCISEDILPENYTFIEMFDYSTLKTLLNNTDLEIIAQLSNPFGKINHVLTRKGLIIPIKETKLDQTLPSYPYATFIQKNLSKLLNIPSTIKALAFLSSILNKNIKIIGVVKRDDGIITAYLNSFGMVLPLNQTDLKTDIPIIDIPFYDNIDNILLFPVTQKTISKDDVLKNDIYKFKVILGRIFSKNPDIVKSLYNIIYNTKMNKFEKIKKLTTFFTKIATKINFDHNNEFIFPIIANEILNDNIQNLILNNLATSEIFNRNDIQKHVNETVILNFDDLQKWSNRFSDDS